MYENLSQYVAHLEECGELIRVSAKVDPVLEIAEITDRISKQEGGGKALLFENTGTSFPVLTNMMGSDRRIALALGVESLNDIGQRIETMFKQVLSPKESIYDKLRLLPLLGEMSRWLPKTSKRRGECQQVVLQGDDANLGLLPILKCWPHDGGRFVTLPLVNTLDPDSGVRNVGMYRMQVTGERTTGMHWHIHKTGERHYQAYRRRGERMPVSIALGGDPIYTYAATAPMPDNMDEYLLAGFLREKSVRLVKCITNDIYVPSDCDFVIEGYVDTAQAKFIEGPFGDHTGFYSLEDTYPEFHVTAITHRRNAIYPATIVGVPPQEDAYIATATEKIFLAPIRLAIQPEVEDLYMPPAGVAHNLALISIRQAYQGQALKTASSMWGAGQMMFNKFIIIADAQVNIRSIDELAPLLRCASLQSDVVRTRGVLDILDHSAEVPGVGGKLALDLTTKRPDPQMSFPIEFTHTQGVDGVSIEFAHQWGAIIVWGAPEAEVDLADFVATNKIKGVNYIVLIDAAAREMSGFELLWFAAQNTEAERDIEIMDGVMLINGRSKFPHRLAYPSRMPNIVSSDLATIALVDERWAEYGLGEPLISPSLKFLTMTIGNGAKMGAVGHTEVSPDTRN